MRSSSYVSKTNLYNNDWTSPIFVTNFTVILRSMLFNCYQFSMLIIINDEILKINKDNGTMKEVTLPMSAAGAQANKANEE